jgi:oligopeptide transport system substrate-binding protein
LCADDGGLAVIPWRFLGLAAALLAGCGARDSDSARLAVTVIGTPWPGGLATRLEAEATRPGLIARDGTGAIVPGLASSWRFVDDDRSLILRLRPTKWSDGAPLGSNEVVAAFRRAAARGEPALRHGAVAGADAIAAGKSPATKLGVLAPISRVVEIRLAAATPQLLGWLAEPGLGVVRDGKSPVVTAGGAPTLGAYRASGAADRRVLARRQGIESDASHPSEIIIASSADPAAAVMTFVRGRSDIVVGDGLAGLGDARAAARPQLLQVDALWGVYGYIANTRRGPLANARLRRALYLATDRAALAARIGLAAMAPVEGLLPPELSASPPPPPIMVARQAQAAALRLEIGPDPIRLTLLLPPGHDHRVIAERVAADWRALGVTLAISELDAGTIAVRVKSGDFDLALTEASLAVPDPAALLARWRCGAGLACDPAADALLDQARAAPPVERSGLLAAAEAQWLTAPPMLPLLTPLRWALVARHVEGWTANPAGSHPLGRLQVMKRQ